MGHHAKILFLSWISLGSWVMTPAWAGFTITTSFDAGENSLVLAPESGANNFLVLSSYATTVTGATAEVMSLDIASLKMAASRTGTSEYEDHFKIKITVTQDGTANSGSIVLDDSMSSSTGTPGSNGFSEYVFNEHSEISLDRYSRSFAGVDGARIVVGGTTFALDFTFNDFSSYGSDPTVNLTGVLSEILFVEPAAPSVPAPSVPEPSSAILAAMGLACVTVVAGRKRIVTARSNRAGHQAPPRSQPRAR